ncbi:MAG TPA: hypothetical protein VHT30_10780 [Acidimicrobiales bacterium]|jgi:hypothetical protein|nr:hypothetical protein [Acidimicrobiales bacterium]
MALSATAQAQTTGPSASGPERFTLIFSAFNGADQPTPVIASGPITGVGTESQVAEPNGTLDLNFSFPNGQVYVTVFNDNFDLRLDLNKCLARPHETGEWSITGGTGAFAGATGEGTLTGNGISVGARSPSGQCLGPSTGVPPVSELEIVHAVGVAAA